jgi:hypothetical protein
MLNRVALVRTDKASCNLQPTHVVKKYQETTFFIVTAVKPDILNIINLLNFVAGT